MRISFKGRDMMKEQHGLPRIELMIAVASIANLDAIAIPACQDYTFRAQVSEGLNLSNGTKAALTEYCQDQSNWFRMIMNN